MLCQKTCKTVGISQLSTDINSNEGEKLNMTIEPYGLNGMSPPQRIHSKTVVRNKNIEEK